MAGAPGEKKPTRRFQPWVLVESSVTYDTSPRRRLLRRRLLPGLQVEFLRSQRKTKSSFTGTVKRSFPVTGARRRDQLLCEANWTFRHFPKLRNPNPTAIYGRSMRSIIAGVLAGLAITSSLFAQIDPEKRQLLQLGYEQPLQGRGPIAGYAFYYLNRPNFFHTNVTLRLAVAPVYIDGEIGISRILGENTDMGVGFSGGGFADDYNEVRGGKYHRDESFEGYGGGGSVSLYHRINPAQKIPLSAVLRGGFYRSNYGDGDETARDFELPSNRNAIFYRTGLRWGGKEPILFPALAMELSVWYEGQFRGDADTYGFANDRSVHESAHLYYGHAYLAYTLPELRHNFSVSVTGGGSIDADRFTSYRLGGVLPFSAEFPLIIPGYYFQEISAESFVLFSGRYLLPLDTGKRWNLNVVAATALVDYLPGLEQPGNWHSGVGAGITYKSKSEIWKIALGYGYGIDAIRDGERGAHNVSFLLQYDLERWLMRRRGERLPDPMERAM